MMVRVETLGSLWMIDETAGRYCRMPLREGPRENGWGAPDQGALADLVWLPMGEHGWRIRADGCLAIDLGPADSGSGRRVVRAPAARLLPAH